MIQNITRKTSVNITDLLDNMYNEYIEELQTVYEMPYDTDYKVSTRDYFDRFNSVVAKLNILRDIKLINSEEFDSIHAYAFELVNVYIDSSKLMNQNESEFEEY